ncbi:hypothetical protein TXYLGN1_10810 [Tepidimicrobium xylanilyticum]
MDLSTSFNVFSTLIWIKGKIKIPRVIPPDNKDLPNPKYSTRRA